jgi:hypothetical protein
MIITVGLELVKNADALRDLMQRINPDTIFDCRAKPTRRAGLGRLQIKALVGAQWSGDKLGGFGHTTDKGLSDARAIAASDRVAVLLCACGQPEGCHLYRDIAVHMPASTCYHLISSSNGELAITDTASLTESLSSTSDKLLAVPLAHFIALLTATPD